jgi:hypothetical protein
MSSDDRGPLPDAPMTSQIQQVANNRLGAVYSALYSFWFARHAATTGSGQGVCARRDAYSVILFNGATSDVLNNDFTSSPDELLDAVLRYRAGGSTNFTAALRAGQTVMEQYWSTERLVTRFSLRSSHILTFLQLRIPVMIFLSDGVCTVPDIVVQDLCRAAVQLG